MNLSREVAMLENDRNQGPPTAPIDPGTLGVEQPITRTRLGTTFLPSRRLSAGDSEINVETRSLEDGRTALFAYSSLPRLVECCGQAQPWVEVTPGRIHEVQRLAAVDLVVWDAELPAELRLTTDDEHD
jgi:hypothetical protein